MTACESSKNIITLFDSFKEDGKVYIITKLARGGDLLNYLNNRKEETLPEKRARSIFSQIVDGLAEAHKNGIVHRDLKHLNIFMSDLTDKPTVKIGDFGLSCHLEDDECITKYAGTLAFMAPEIVKSEPADAKADVWSLAVILYTVISGRLPFSGSQRDEISRKIVEEPVDFSRPIWAEISDECKQLLTGMLAKDQN